VERSTLGKTIQTAHAEGKDWKKELSGFMLQYRTTPHSKIGVAPAETLFKLNIRNGIPALMDSKSKLHDKSHMQIEQPS